MQQGLGRCILVLQSSENIEKYKEIYNVFVGKDVYIWDNDILTVEEVASWISDLCNYEILTSISSRVERVFVYDNN